MSHGIPLNKVISCADYNLEWMWNAWKSLLPIVAHHRPLKQTLDRILHSADAESRIVLRWKRGIKRSICSSSFLTNFPFCNIRSLFFFLSSAAGAMWALMSMTWGSDIHHILTLQIKARWVGSAGNSDCVRGKPPRLFCIGYWLQNVWAALRPRPY